MEIHIHDDAESGPVTIHDAEEVPAAAPPAAAPAEARQGTLKWYRARALVKHYQGAFVGVSPHGEGRMVWLPSENQAGQTKMYTGSWVAGQQCGHGKAWWLQGATKLRCYTGSWLADKAHGVGVLVSPTKTVLGVWDAGSPAGTCVVTEGTTTRRLVYHDGARFEVLEGELGLAGGNKQKYVGEFIVRGGKPQQHGHGCVTFEGGGSYDGGWAFGRWCGRGVHIDALDDKWTGRWLG